MTSFLDDMAEDIYAGFKGDMRPCVLRRPDTQATASLNSFGDVSVPVPARYDCEGFKDEYSAYFRRENGIPATDSMICIFGASLPVGIVPLQDDMVLIEGQWYQLRKADTDPAGALWECQGFTIAVPPTP